MIGLRACPTPAGDDCVAMTPSIIQPGNHASVRIRPSYAGWYVGAVERVSGMESWTMEGHVQAPDAQQARPAPRPGGSIAAGDLIGPVR